MTSEVATAIIYYGDDKEAWERGDIFGHTLEVMEKTDKEKFDLFTRGGQEKWYELFKKHNKRWPHPDKHILKISKFFPDLPMKWIPELNYIIIYIPMEMYPLVIKEIKKITPYVHCD